jgi:hypothetical protein
MKNVLIILLCLLAFGTCLAIGISTGDFQPPSSPPNPTNPPALASSPTYHNQINVLLIWVDNLKKDRPRLISFYLVLFKPDQPTLTLLLLYPSPKEPYKNLAEEFKLTPSGELDAAFTSKLQSFEFGYQGYRVIDEDGFTQWIDWLGGIDTGTGRQDGATVLAHMPRPWDDFNLAQEQQKKIATGICNKMNLLPVDTNWSGLLASLIPDHFQTDLSIQETILAWQDLAGSQEKFRCKILSP